MELPDSLHDFLSKEMDRKEFLRHSVVGMLMLGGGGLIIKHLERSINRGK